MAGVLDYVAWRGDLSFSDSKFGEVDGSILSMLSYIDFGALCGGEKMRLCDAEKIRVSRSRGKSEKLGLIIPSEHISELFAASASSRRFGNVEVSDYESCTSEELMCQFAAVTFHLSGGRMAVAFRGTDDTVVGWREDVGLSYLDKIPSQALAVDYLERVADKYPNKRIYTCGHSKGGNLSLYSVVNCKDEVAVRVLKAYSYDGPGLDDASFGSPRYKAMRRKLEIIIPQSSFIGIMFNVGDRYTVVNGTRKGAFQHDSFYWNVRGATFEHLDALSERGKKNEEQFKVTMSRMSVEERREFADTLFSIVETTGAKTLTELTRGGIKHLGIIVKNYNGLDKQKREIILGLFLKLFDLKHEKAEK